MAIAFSVRRFVRLGWRNQRLLVEAGTALIAASAMVRLLPFRRAIRSGSIQLGRRGRDPTELRALCWSVERVAGTLPWRPLCFEQGLAAQAMLRRRGLDALLHYGMGKPGSGELAAHVWVSVDGKVVMGGESAEEFAEVASFPAWSG